jgi:hypothetical protein
LGIEAAVRHGVFDLLDQGPKGVEEIAKATGTSIRGMRAILNLLVSLELLARTDTRYGLAPESAAFLVSTKPGYHGMFFHHISDQLLPRWMQLSEIVRTGKPVATVNDQSEGAERTGPPVTLIFAVNMLVNTEAGDTFTFSEMSEWLRAAGFVNPRLLEVPSVSPLVLADKPV